MIRYIFLLFSIHLLSFSVQAGSRSPAPSRVAFLIYLDLSPSMEKLRERVSVIGQMIHDSMENSQCTYSVAVNNIQYQDAEYNYTRPIGFPQFVTRDTPDGPNLVAKRIRLPIETITRSVSGLNGRRVWGTEELTYSSVVDSIDQLHPDLLEYPVVSTLLISDAAPAFERYQHAVATQKVKEMLKGKRHLHAALGPNLFLGMKNRDTTKNIVIEEKGARSVSDYKKCSIDLSNAVATQVTRKPEAPFTTSHWNYGEIDAIERFVKDLGGWYWDICSDQSENNLREYIQMVLELAECQYYS